MIFSRYKSYNRAATRSRDTGLGNNLRTEDVKTVFLYSVKRIKLSGMACGWGKIISAVVATLTLQGERFPGFCENKAVRAGDSDQQG